MFGWDAWKKGFDAWENTTASYLEQWLKSPLVLGPAGAFLAAAMKSRAAADRATASWWAAMGLPTRMDQERMLHELHQMQSRIMDLEEQLATARAKHAASED
jgi:hypothetical protein